VREKNQSIDKITRELSDSFITVLRIRAKQIDSVKLIIP
jgi:hypothetical protein